MNSNVNEQSRVSDDALSYSDVSRYTGQFIVGVAGGTGAGKTTFSRKFAKALSMAQTVTEVDLDSCRDLHTAPMDFMRLHEDVRRLKHTQSSGKLQDGRQLVARDSDAVWVPVDIIIAEGSVIFADETIRELFDLKIFVDTPPDIRLRRRLERDIRETGYSLVEAVDHYLAVVLPIHDHFIEPAKQTADVIVSGCEDSDTTMEDIVEHVVRRIRNEAALSSTYNGYGFSSPTALGTSGISTGT
jgi:uridine kinase